MDSLDNLLSPRTDNLTLEVDAERVEWPLDTFIPDKDTSFIHLDTAETETDLWDLFMPNKSCVFFSFLHSCDLFRYTFKV